MFRCSRRLFLRRHALKVLKVLSGTAFTLCLQQTKKMLVITKSEGNIVGTRKTGQGNCCELPWNESMLGVSHGDGAIPSRALACKS